MEVLTKDNLKETKISKAFKINPEKKEVEGE